MSAPSTPTGARRPVIVLGAPRSGTSLLCDVLESHPDVLVLREPRLVWRFGNDSRSDQLRPEHARSEVVEHIHAHFSAALRERGVEQLVEKTPANSVRPLFVDAVFPDARYVHITRNGWAAVPSIRDFSTRRGSGLDGRQVRKLRRRLREASPSQVAHYVPELARRLAGPGGRRPALYGPRLAGLAPIAEELGGLEAAALQWRTCVDSATTFGRALSPDRYLEVRLERLDRETIVTVLEFCGLAVVDDVLEHFQAAYSPEAGLKRSALTDLEQAVIAPYVSPANVWLGYDEPSLVSAG
ncbi:MAG: sulfotransferase [Deltaproteobacteria bacterium]|nr:sulfotransferase [Deltaproteobacteria bacterium]